MEAYQTPESEIENISEEVFDQHDSVFYIVSKKKFIILFIFTLGLYSIYWFYQNWQNYKVRTNAKIWPIARAIFSIFFIHSLFGEIDQRLKVNKTPFSWSPNLYATFCVIFLILERVTGKLAQRGVGSPITDCIELSCFPFIGIILYKAQKAVNLACHDPEGLSNSKFTTANYLWIVLGSILWIFILLFLLMLVIAPDLLIE